MHISFWLLLSLLAATFIAGVLVAWNNPKKKLQGLLDDAIAKAKVTANADVQNVLNEIKSKL